jgi:hypothetical protein
MVVRALAAKSEPLREIWRNSHQVEGKNRPALELHDPGAYGDPWRTVHATSG